jgi:hypothetical protein
MIGPELLLVGAVAAVGVLHTIVPDHWVPITLIARQQHWTRGETARAALQAGTGHVLSTLAIAVVVWITGVAFAQRFGHYVDTVAGLALIGFGGWIAVFALLEMRGAGGHHHHHHHDHHHHDHAAHEHHHESHDPIHRPELEEVNTEHDQAATARRTSSRTALLLILGSSPMVEGIPAFFAAGRYGPGLIALMSFVFALSTIATYVVLCVYSTAGLQRITLGPLEHYGEVLSGFFIAAVGIVFWAWPVL